MSMQVCHHPALSDHDAAGRLLLPPPTTSRGEDTHQLNLSHR